MTSSDYPRVFGPYLLLSSFGRGGMGEVFLAKRRAVGDVDRLCVVKTLRGDLAESKEYVGRFLDEARLSVQLTHPAISQVFDVGQVGLDHFVAMEFIPGANLRDLQLDLSKKSRRLDEGLALFLIGVVLDALAYAHRLKSPTDGTPLKVIHRDVSPANIMVGHEGEVKLIDFGLAESSLKQEHTETRLVMGKVAYMAPEQARGDELDGSCDQFAAAVVLYELLVGDRFYGAMNAHEIWQVVGHGGFRPARFNELDVEVRQLLDRALAPLPRDRFPTSDAMAAALDELRARRHPRAGKTGLRQLMDVLYADQREAQRDLIASFADVRAPIAPSTPSAGLAPLSRDQPASGTEPWHTSPSSPFGVAPVSAGPLPGEAVAAREPEATVPGRPAAARDPGGSVVSAAVERPKNTAAAVVVGALVVVAAVAVGALLAWPDAPVVAAAAVDAGVVAAVTPPAPPLAVVDAGVAEAPADGGVDLPADAGVAVAALRPRTKSPKTDVPVVAPRPSDPAPPPVEPVEPVKPVEPVEPAAAPATTTLEEDIATVGRCRTSRVLCAEGAHTAAQKKPQNAFEARAQAKLVSHCATKCRAAGVP